MDIQKEKEEIIQNLQDINNSVTKEELQKASTDELLKYAKLNLEIRKKIEMLQALENNK